MYEYDKELSEYRFILLEILVLWIVNATFFHDVKLLIYCILLVHEKFECIILLILLLLLLFETYLKSSLLTQFYNHISFLISHTFADK